MMSPSCSRNDPCAPDTNVAIQPRPEEHSMNFPWYVGAIHNTSTKHFPSLVRSVPLILLYILVYYRSPRWTINSDSPRMLLVLVRKFESRRGEILNLFTTTKKRKKDQLLRAPSVGKPNSTRVDEARKS